MVHGAGQGETHWVVIKYLKARRSLKGILPVRQTVIVYADEDIAPILPSDARPLQQSDLVVARTGHNGLGSFPIEQMFQSLGNGQVRVFLKKTSRPDLTRRAGH